VYLIWIGIKALRGHGLALAHQRPRQPLASIFRQSIIGNLLNPKVTLFFLVFLPQFVNQPAARATGNGVWQMLLLGAVFMLQTVLVFAVFGWCAGTLGGWLKRRPQAGVWLDRLAGATFIAIGLRVALHD
jgi:threonine/homoserine/homoserine lactone efflux protein